MNWVLINLFGFLFLGPFLQILFDLEWLFLFVLIQLCIMFSGGFEMCSGSED